MNLDSIKWLVGLGGAALLVEIWRTIVGFVKWLYGKRHAEKSVPEQVADISTKLDVLGTSYDKQYHEISAINSKMEKMERVLNRNGVGTGVCLDVSKAILEGLKRHGYDLNGEGREAEKKMNDYLSQNTKEGLQM